MKYIFIDTCVVVNCAFSKTNKANPDLFKKILDYIKQSESKLIMPEVVELEIAKVIARQSEEQSKVFNRIIEYINEQDGLGSSMQKTLEKYMEKKRKEVRENANELLDSINEIIKDNDCTERVAVGEKEITNSIKWCISGKKPSKNKDSNGMLQSDCLIVFALKGFMDNESDADLIICTDNIKDFSQDMGDNKDILHADIGNLFDSVKYYIDPVSMLENEFKASDTSDEGVNKLSDEYKKVSSAFGSGLAKVAELIRPDFGFNDVVSNAMQVRGVDASDFATVGISNYLMENIAKAHSEYSNQLNMSALHGMAGAAIQALRLAEAAQAAISAEYQIN